MSLIKPGMQNGAFKPGMSHEIGVIPSNNPAVFGGMVTFDVKQVGSKLHDLILQFITNAPTGLSGTAAGFPRFSPAQFWIQRAELLIGSQIIDTIYGDALFLLTQQTNEDEDRLIKNATAGLYSNATQRNTMTITNGQDWYVSLRSFVQQTHFHQINGQSQISIRIYLNNLSNVLSQSTLTGTPSVTVAANLLTRHTKLSLEDNQNYLVSINKSPRPYFYHQLRYQNAIVQTGTSSANIILSSITGSIAQILFVIRPTASLVGDNAFNYTKLLNYSILDAQGTNVTSGQTISDAEQTHFDRWWYMSSYPVDPAVGTSNAYVYLWSWSSDPALAINGAMQLGSKRFVGSETLKLQFTSALAAPVSVDIFAYAESVFTHTPTGVTVQAL